MSTWRRSSACLDNACVEVAYLSACESSACVEVANDSDRVFVRCSERPETVVEFTREEWAAFLDGVKRGEFDVGELACLR